MEESGWRKFDQILAEFDARDACIGESLRTNVFEFFKACDGSDVISSRFGSVSDFKRSLGVEAIMVDANDFVVVVTFFIELREANRGISATAT